VGTVTACYLGQGAPGPCEQAARTAQTAGRGRGGRSDGCFRLLPARAARRHLGRRHCRSGRCPGSRGSAGGGRGGAGEGRSDALCVSASPAVPPGRRRSLGRGEAARVRRPAGTRAHGARGGVLALGRGAGGGDVGRAGGRARAVSRERLPAPDGGARRRRQPGGGAPGLRALSTAPRRRARRVPVAGDRLDLSRPARGSVGPARSTARARSSANGRRSPETKPREAPGSRRGRRCRHGRDRRGRKTPSRRSTPRPGTGSARRRSRHHRARLPTATARSG
jgi:hypothetical protein